MTTVEQWESRFDTFSTMHEGCRMQWYQLGNGARPLVLVHGGHGSWMHWLRNIDPLHMAGFTLWLPDLPGFGRSDTFAAPPNDPNRLTRIADALAAGLDQMLGQDGEVDLAAFSFGGLISTLTARRRTISRLALLGPAGHGTPARLRREAFRGWRTVEDPAARSAALRENLVMFMFADEHQADALAVEAHERSCEATRFRSTGLPMAGMLVEQLASFEGPVLGLWGRNDLSCTPESVLHAVVDGHPQRQGRILPNAGHWVQYEAAKDVNAALIEWLSH